MTTAIITTTSTICYTMYFTVGLLILEVEILNKMYWVSNLRRRQKETAFVLMILKYFCIISQLIGLILDERKFIKICHYISNLNLSLNL